MSIDEQPMNVYWSGQKSPASNKYKINYKGTVATASVLPTTGNKKGDTYNVSEDGSNYIWTGSEWDKLGSNVYVGATSSEDGIQGLVPPASNSQIYSLLTGGGTWESVEDLGLALDNEVVHLTGDETINGVKNFTESVNVKSLGSTAQVDNETGLPSSTEKTGFYLVSSKDGGAKAFFEASNYSDGSSIARLASSNIGGTQSLLLVSIQSDGTRSVYPGGNGTHNLGASNHRWGQIYSSSATIETSDARLKTKPEQVPDKVLDAWGNVQFCQFKMLDSVKEKGEKARLHNGLIAQHVEEAFKVKGLDASRYGLFCWDSWDAKSDEIDDSGNIVYEGYPAGETYSLRYEEVLCMEATYQRRRAERAEARIKALEDRLEALEAKLA